jgi:hypothetical protein
VKALLQQTARLLGALALLYAVLIGISILLVPLPSPIGTFDTDAAKRSIFMTEPKYVFMNRQRLEATSIKPRVIVLGASNAAFGIRPDALEARVPTVSVQNMAIGGANMTEIHQALDLAQSSLSDADERRTIFVVGSWYGVFMDNEVRWSSADRTAGDTDLDIERYRYGFVRRDKSGPMEVIPDRTIDTATLAIYPLLALDKVSRDMTAGLRKRFLGRAKNLSDEQRNAKIVSDTERARMMAYWRTAIGHDQLQPQQFAEFDSLIDDALKGGAQVVVADLPIPTWHEQQSPYFLQYQQMKLAILSKYSSNPGFGYVNLQYFNRDDSFSDEVHPKPKDRGAWLPPLAIRLRTMADSLTLQGTRAP